MPDSDGNATSLEMLADYECPECGRLDEDSLLSEDDALMILGGDENGFVRCPNDWCREELEPTPEATADMLAFVAERLGQQTTMTERTD